MKFFERVGSLFRSSDAAPTPGIDPGLRAQFEEARRAKLAENFPLAHEKLDHALELIKRTVDHPAAVEILLQRTDVFCRQGNYAEALRALDGARSKAGEQKLLQAHVLLGRGRLAFAEGKLDEASVYYDQALALGRSVSAAGLEGRAQALRGELALRENNASYSLHLLREALPRLNNAGDGELSPLFVGLLGVATLQTGGTSDGVRLVERALKIAEQLGDVANQRRWALFLGERALHEARYAEARIYLRLASDRFGDQKSHEHLLTLYRLGFVLGVIGQREEALAVAEQAMRIAEGEAPASRALAQAALGAALRGSGRGDEAIPHLRAAAEDIDVREKVEVVRLLANALAESGDLDAARTAFANAVTQADAHGTPLERAQARRDLGLLHFRAKAWHEALTAWSAALTLFEEENAHAQVARLLCDLGSARKTLGMQARALRDYEQALTVLNAVDSYDLDTRGLVYSNAAHAFAEQGGDSDSVDSFFTEAIALAEKVGDRAAESLRRNNYGYFLVQTGRPRRAIALLEQALRQSESLDMTLLMAIQRDNLGLAHAAAGEYPTALVYHRQALEMVQGLNEPHWQTSIAINLGRALLLMGDTDSASELLRNALADARADGAPELLARALLTCAQRDLADTPASAQSQIDEALQIARRADLRRWVAEALALRADAQAASGDGVAARATWAEAAELYTRLRMPQGKKQPAWMVKEVTSNEG
jgi:tetratricopeptide (TPR) repeat protein